MRPICQAAILLFIAGSAAGAPSDPPAAREIDAALHHLGNSSDPRFADAGVAPEATAYELSFQAKANPGEWVIAIAQRDVSDAWTVTLNGTALGQLDRTAEARDCFLPVPAGTLKDGANRLEIAARKVEDDVVVGNVRLFEGTLREVFRLAPVSVEVVDRATGSAIPARVDIRFRDAPDAKPRLFHPGPASAIRSGLAYTGTGRLECELKPGAYVVDATRGMEWGHASQVIEVEPSTPVTLRLAIAREVDSKGFVAADTHVHTVTYSGHGDASVDERMITIAAEGVELAIATDHNHHTDYGPPQHAAGLDGSFTAVTGNEVTTDIGHFTAFPLPVGGATPDSKLGDYVKLVSDMRAKGAKVVFLNHPRWPRPETGPFAQFAVDPASGEMKDGAPELTFDALEVINSNVPTNDPLMVFTDWFALLNRGHRLFAVGSSDSHTVDMPVGQGRTFVRSATDDPTQIDVDACCAAFRAGDFAISYGILVTARVNGVATMGATVPVQGGRADVEARVQAPAWVHPSKLVVYVDGHAAAEQALACPPGETTDRSIALKLELPHHDAWLAVVVLGDAVRGPWWPAAVAYTLGATNPFFLDADADGRCASPLDVAKAALPELKSPSDVAAALARLDDGAAIQLLALLLDDPQRRDVVADLMNRKDDGFAGRERLVKYAKRRTAPAPIGP